MAQVGAEPSLALYKNHRLSSLKWNLSKSERVEQQGSNYDRCRNGLESNARTTLRECPELVEEYFVLAHRPQRSSLNHRFL